MYYVKETKTISRKISKGVTEYRVVETGRLIPVPYTPSRKESAVESAYYGGGYGTSDISIETFAKTYFKQ